MFSSALKSFSSNISSNYQISPHPSFISGPWKVHDGKKKTTGNAASIFIFERKSLDPRAGGLGPRSGSSSMKKIHEEVVERLKREASNLARLRHPSVLQILEPVEETRSGGLMFAAEPVTASLAGLLQEKDEQERVSGLGGRTSRFMVEESDGTRRRREIEIDELEIQKGLLQVGKGLEFLHESAGLVHGNLTPDAIYINAKSDWKISGLAFAGPADSATQSSLPPLALSEVLYYDPRLPKSVQLDMDYCSPDFILDSNVSASADLFSLGLIIVALYNSPHTSPIQTHNNITTYKKLLSSSSTIPSQSNGFLSSRPIPKDLASQVLPRLITRRPAQRMNSREFQQSQYFDNVLVSTIRFLESLPAKTPNEKSQFMRGLARVLPEFPSSVLERKVLGALLEECKDKELLSLILQNVFKIIKSLPSSRRVVPDKVIPRLNDVFLSNGPKPPVERDSSRDAGLMVVLENMQVIADNCSGKEFKDDVLPLIRLGLESPTHSLVDASLKCLPVMLPILDFSTVKDDVFPPIASVFAKTSSLAIKVRGLESFVLLCGGSNDSSTDSGDDLSGIVNEPRAAKSGPSTSILDKYTVQEKVVPLLKAMKTKEPAVMIAALNVFRQVGQIADVEFIALEVLPILWNFGLGPLLDVQQFGKFMDLIKNLSNKVEREHTKKLQALASSNDFSKRDARSSTSGAMLHTNGNGELENVNSDFERLVLGKTESSRADNNIWDDWSSSPNPSKPTGKVDHAANFSWSSTTSGAAATSTSSANRSSFASMSNSRSITPDMSIGAFPALAPTSRQTQPSGSSFPSLQPSLSPQPSSFASPTPRGPATMSPPALSQTPQNNSFSYSIPPPPGSKSQQPQSSSNFSSMTGRMPVTAGAQQQPQTGSSFSISSPAQNTTSQQRQGLDRHESLL